MEINKKQEEQLKFIEIASELNEEIWEKWGEPEDTFSYSTDGYNDLFSFGNRILWSSENDDREFIEKINDYEPFKEYIKGVFNSWASSISSFKF